jgi:ABC-2 type transport system ATP-binding protein
LGFITQTAQSVLTTSGPGPNYLLPSISVPTLDIQGTVDVLFTLQQAINNAAQSGSPDQQMIWYCGGHGVCLTDQVANIDSTGTRNVDATVKFLDKNVKGDEVSTGPTFQSGFLPTGDHTTNPDFYGPSIEAVTGADG